jgi:hypothetical protein
LEKIIENYLAQEGLDWDKASRYQERRQYPRKAVSLPARLTVQDASEICEETEALIENISLGGSYVTYTNGDRPSWQLQSSIRLLVRIPQKSTPLRLACRAVRVIRDQQKIGVGLQYVDPSPQTLDLIEGFLGRDSAANPTSSGLPLQ